ncbi:hypothetical protein AQPE_1756 [Aquipluma nitroreducens]|uniref:Uncharacterized protein n=1 Tax=Aquipluma nitroreducens TaxID=2010828 RepID=A0A5K7S821_9BACT|nr:hypothetical protein AQPE_1756 [Aquipluma nitroreducens]
MSVGVYHDIAHYPCSRFGKSDAPEPIYGTKQTCFEHAVPDDY